VVQVRQSARGGLNGQTTVGEKDLPEVARGGAHFISNNQPPLASSLNFVNFNNGTMSSLDIRHHVLVYIQCVLSRLLEKV
jgi:hypothetical protein